MQKPTMHRARDIAEVILSQYERGELDEVYIVYTRMENSMLTTVEKMKILPLERSSFNEMKMPLNIHRGDRALSISRGCSGQHRTKLRGWHDLWMSGRGICKRTQCANDSNAISNRQRAGNHQRSFYYI